MAPSTRITFPLSLLALGAALVAAKTDLSGCTTTDVSSPAGASVAWYVPGTGELCNPLDCGGGRAPPKYSVPGCPQYTGTETYSPSFLAGYGAAIATAIASSSIPAVTSAVATTSAPPTASSAHTETSVSSFAVPTPSSGFFTTVTGSSATVSVAQSDKPLICAIANKDPNCGINWSTTTYSDVLTIQTISPTPISNSSAVGVITSVASLSRSASTSLTISLVESLPNKTTTAGATGSQTASSSSSASVGVSTGAASGMTGMFGGLGFLAAAVGAVAAL